MLVLKVCLLHRLRKVRNLGLRDLSLAPSDSSSGNSVIVSSSSVRDIFLFRVAWLMRWLLTWDPELMEVWDFPFPLFLSFVAFLIFVASSFTTLPSSSSNLIYWKVTCFLEHRLLMLLRLFRLFFDLSADKGFARWFSLPRVSWSSIKTWILGILWLLGC